MDLVGKHVDVLGMRLDCVDYQLAAGQIVSWAKVKSSGYVCAANVHMVMEGWDDVRFRRQVNGGRLVVPDGMPLVWAMRLLGCDEQTRVYGPTLMQHCLQLAAEEGVRVGLIGGRNETLSRLKENFIKAYPNIQIDYMFSYPYGSVSSSTLGRILDEIRLSGIELLFVGLGCPKQEKWMAEVSDVLPMILVGVGAAFDFFAGNQPMAPTFLQKMGMEWAFRLAVEPRRLFARYAKHNPRFVLHFLTQLLLEKKKAPRAGG